MQRVIFLKKALIISGVFISGLIGAGFSTGSEIYYFFSKFGKTGFFGIITAVFLFSLIQYAVLVSAKHLKTYTIDEYFSCIMNKPLGLFSSIISYIFMLIVFSAMLSGLGEMLYTLFGIKRIYAALFMLLCCYVILKKGYNMFVHAQSIMSVGITLLIFVTCLWILFFREESVSVFSVAKSQASAITYVSYNTVSSAAVLCVLARDTDKKVSLFSSIFTFFALLLIMCLLWGVICIYSGKITLGSIPMLTIAQRTSVTCAYIYSIAIFLSMLTTAVSNSFVLIDKVKKYTGKNVAIYLILALGLLLSSFDFSFIVDSLYRLMGYISIFIVVCILKNIYKKSNLLSKSAKYEENKRI